MELGRINPLELFGMYMGITGVPTLSFPKTGDPRLAGKKLGVINGSSWTNLWSTWFGRQILPEVKLVQVGNEGVQLNFMNAHNRGEPCPPQINIDLFCRYAEDLWNLCKVDAVIITCSTMNRSAQAVRKVMEPHRVPVVQIDEAMMEEAVSRGGKVLVIATHGPTVKSTQDLLRETAGRLGKPLQFTGAAVEEAFDLLGMGDIEGHNNVIEKVIRKAVRAEDDITTIVLAQLSMSVFGFTWPSDSAAREFGAPVLTSGETGFRRVRDILLE
jgi:Asp/Glu/hydantoin racemase